MLYLIYMNTVKQSPNAQSLKFQNYYSRFADFFYFINNYLETQ